MALRETKVIQRTEHIITITVDEFRKAFGLSDFCMITLDTPSGPAWHSSSVGVASISKFVATWSEEKSINPTNS